MLNLIRMNLFRMVHTKSAVIVFAILMGMSVISSCMTADDSREILRQMEEKQIEERQTEEMQGTPGNVDKDSETYTTDYQSEEEMSGDFGIYVNAPVNNDGTLKDYVYIYCSELSSGLLVLFILIGAVLFFRGDEKNGFIKNIAGQTKHKYNILLSKLAVTGIYTFICMFCYMLVGYITFITGFALDGGIDFGIEYLPEAVKVFAIQYLLYMAFISGLLLVTEVTKSTASGITIGLLAIMGFGTLFVAIVQKVFNTEFNISKYYINTNITKVNMGAGQEAVSFAIVIGIVFFILYNVLNVLWFSKRDIV